MGNICGKPSGPSGDIKTLDKNSNDYKVDSHKSEPLVFGKHEIEAAIVAAKEELARKRGRSFESLYTTSNLIGHGAFAKVMVCTRVADGKQFAVKVVAKSAEKLEEQYSGIHREIAIMHILRSHPNVVQLIDIFEDATSFKLVMELCSGGELFDQIISKGHFSEREAADKMKSLVDVIRFAHSKNIIHRDLKPENILLSDATPNAILKVIDFGTSDFCLDGHHLTQKFGTPYYVAPEVLKKHYDKSADIWSAGVILYILLCGYPPFGGKTDARILARVQAGAFSFEGQEWVVVTQAAKDMISAMLTLDPRERASAEELLRHPWFTAASTAPAAALGLHMVKRLKAFSSMGKMKRLALVVLARNLTDKDVQRLRELFGAMDADKDGLIDAGDLHSALDRVGAAIDAAEMEELIRASDINGAGQIDYEEFIAAMLDSKKVARRRDAVRRSFEVLDSDGDGFITAEDLAKELSRRPAGRAGAHNARSSMDLAAEILAEADKDNEGRVGFEQFQAMMNS